jgi:peptidoglycan/LPS O-acetylase OafA/YrhL
MDTQGQRAATGQRLHFLDNLRTAMILLVVLYHAGVTYESTGVLDVVWIVDDPDTNDVVGLVNLIVDIFVMPTIFFVSGYFAPSSVQRRPGRDFVIQRFRRLMVPWLLAVLILMPLYKVIFLYSRGMPQEHWATYFHFSNGLISQSWLWFLPILFLFDVLFWAATRTGLRPPRISMRTGVAATFVLGVAYSFTVTVLGKSGWTKTPFVDFQNEKVLVYLLVFLLGALAHRHRVFDTAPRGKGLYIALAATVWIPMNLYVIVLLNLFFNPGGYFLSLPGDLLLIWIGFQLSMLSMVYLLVMTFRFWVDQSGPLARSLGANAYGVYVLHMIVMGVVALAVRPTGLPSLAKYAVLAVATWVVSNVLVQGYRTVVKPRLGTSR